MFERMDQIYFKKTMPMARSINKWLCPRQMFKANRFAECQATYLDFMLHGIPNILVTLIYAKYLLSSIRALKAHFKLKAVHWLLEVVGYTIAVWLPLRLLWPGLIFIVAKLAKGPLEHDVKLLGLEIKPILCLIWLELALFLFAVVLLFFSLLSFHSWQNSIAENLRSLRYCFGRIPGAARLRNCFRPEFPIISGLSTWIRRCCFPPLWLRIRPATAHPTAVNDQDLNETDGAEVTGRSWQNVSSASK